MILQENIANKIFLIRGKKVMLDRDLARLYGVETRVLNQAVRRNITRFPKDFMFQLKQSEMDNWISQIGVGLIKSVDNVCHCSSISFSFESVLWPIVRVIEDWKPSDFCAINLG